MGKGRGGEETLGAKLSNFAGERCVILHDRRIPGSRANIDQLAITPGGVFVIDAKNYAGQVQKRDLGGWFRTDIRLYVGRRDCTKLLHGSEDQAEVVRDALAPLGFTDIPVRPVLCFVGAEWGLFAKPFKVGSVLVTYPKFLYELLQKDSWQSASTWPPSSSRRLSRVGDEDRLVQLLGEVKLRAREYRELTGRPLGVTGEVAEYEAARLLGVELATVRQAGYDAIRQTPTGPQRLQIKGRCILPEATPGQRVGGIKLETEWDVVLLVLLDEAFDATAIYEADRPEVEAALLAPGSRARNERGALGVSKFKSIGRKVWP